MPKKSRCQGSGSKPEGTRREWSRTDWPLLANWRKWEDKPLPEPGGRLCGGELLCCRAAQKDVFQGVEDRSLSVREDGIIVARVDPLHATAQEVLEEKDERFIVRTAGAANVQRRIAREQDPCMDSIETDRIGRMFGGMNDFKILVPHLQPFPVRKLSLDTIDSCGRANFRIVELPDPREPARVVKMGVGEHDTFDGDLSDTSPNRPDRFCNAAVGPDVDKRVHITEFVRAPENQVRITRIHRTGRMKKMDFHTAASSFR